MKRHIPMPTTQNCHLQTTRKYRLLFYLISVVCILYTARQSNSMTEL